MRAPADDFGSFYILPGSVCGLVEADHKEADPDFAILCAVQEAPLDGPAAWARRTGIDPSTLRRRLERLQETGALRGFTAIPAAEVFGRTYTPHRFQLPDGCDMDAILDVPDVAWAARALGGHTHVITYEHGVSRRAQLEKLLGPHHGDFRHADAPGPHATIGRIGLRVLRELLLDPRASIQDLAERTGLGKKTVRSHRANLIAKRLVKIDALLRTPDVPGRLFYNLAIEVDKLGHRRTVADAVPDAVIINLFDEPPVAYMFATAAGLLEQARHVDAIRSLPHVKKVRLMVNEDFRVAVPRLVRWCNEAIEAWTPAELSRRRR